MAGTTTTTTDPTRHSALRKDTLHVACDLHHVAHHKAAVGREEKRHMNTSTLKSSLLLIPFALSMAVAAGCDSDKTKATAHPDEAKAQAEGDDSQAGAYSDEDVAGAYAEDDDSAASASVAGENAEAEATATEEPEEDMDAEAEIGGDDE